MSIAYKDFLVRLRTARKEAGLTQIEAATALGRTQASISKIEQGEAPLSVEELFDCAKLYGKPITYFVEGLE